MNQNYKPELVPHFIYEYPDHCVLENGNTGEQGVFSREEGLYLKYFNGTMTLREIVNELQFTEIRSTTFHVHQKCGKRIS